jgi:hypothetical protein
MNEEKLKQILNKIGQADVPPNATLIAERASRNFDAALKIVQPKQWFFTPLRLIATAAVIIFMFTAGRWSKSIPQASPSPEVAVYTKPISTYPAVDKNTESFWQQKALAAMQPRPYAQTMTLKTELLNAYKQYLKEKHYD